MTLIRKHWILPARPIMPLLRAWFSMKNPILCQLVGIIVLKIYREAEKSFFIYLTISISTKRQIVITSDCPPEAIDSLEDRLVSRFKWELLCGIDDPAIETRVAIIEKKSLWWGINLSHELVQYLAKNIAGNIREVEGTLLYD